MTKFNRQGAELFPLMVVLSITYPCNFGCPNCPYSDGNSELRQFYHKKKADFLPEELWSKIAAECGEYGAWMRCTGGGEPMLHPQMVEMIELAKSKGAKIWLNTNGSKFGPSAKLREKLERIIKADIDMIEFSMDAGDAVTYSVVRPPYKGTTSDINKRWKEQVNNVRVAIEFRKKYQTKNRIVVSIIRQDIMEGKLDKAIKFWMEDVGVDEVITRKFLNWDNNTSINLEHALDKNLYTNHSDEKKEPCVWPFERLNVDTLGRIALCGQDIAFSTAKLFPTVWEKSIKEIWHGDIFNWYRRKHLEGKGAECSPCNNCSAWFAGVRDWEHGWLKVLEKVDKNREKISNQR